MLIVGFGKTFTVHDQVHCDKRHLGKKNILNDRHQAPKKLIMRTLARAAMETDKALEEEDMYWLKVAIQNYTYIFLTTSYLLLLLQGETGPQAPCSKVSGAGTMMRVHASPSLNKRAEAIGVIFNDQ